MGPSVPGVLVVGFSPFSLCSWERSLDKAPVLLIRGGVGRVSGCGEAGNCEI